MPFIPHTDADVAPMLAAIGVSDMETLFDEIPPQLRCDGALNLPEPLGEMAARRLMEERASKDSTATCFLGAGAYEHHIPAAVWELATRGEFYTAYTPYQAEASQGTLQLLYEFQSMLAGLNDMAVANASLYDGASALAEAILMSLRARHAKPGARVLLPEALNPAYLDAVTTITAGQNIVYETIPCGADGRMALTALRGALPGSASLVVAQPNFFGVLEAVDEIAQLTQSAGTSLIAQVNPLSLALLQPPGQWGTDGADIACGEGQPLGIPLSAGGPYFGFIACRAEWLRQMPGRIVGRTLDDSGETAYTLTLQAREQHIRRGKATSNICTNQGLMATAATLYMSLMGPAGLAEAATLCNHRLQQTVAAITRLPGVSRLFDAAVFNECVVTLPKPVEEVLAGLLKRGFLGGYNLGRAFPQLGNALLVCATETRTESDIAAFAKALGEVLVTA